MGKKTIIIGAGLGGLTTGLLLKKARPEDEVVIYDSNKIPGGLCTAFPKATTYEGEKIVYTINIPLLTSDFIKDEPFDKLFKYLEVTNIKWKAVERLFQFYPLDADPFLFDKHGDQTLINRARSEKEARALEKFFNGMKKLYHDLFFKANMPPKPLQALRMLFTIPGTVTRLLMDKPYLKAIEKIGVESQDIKDILCAAEAFMGVDADKVTAVGEMAMIQSFLENTAVQPCDGDTFQTLADNMAEKFASMGGKLVYSQKVDEVIFENNSTSGVMVNGEKVAADNVILSVAQDALAPLIQKGKHLGPVKKLLKKIDSLPAPNSDYYCYYLIDKETVEKNPKLTDVAYHVVRLKDGVDESNWKLAWWVPPQLYNDKYYVLALVMTEQDQEKVDWWIKLRDEDSKKYNAEKEKVAEKYLKMLQDIEPVFKEHPPLKHVLTMTPASYLPYGSKYPICGIAQTPDNFGVKRIRPRILKNLHISSGANFSGGLWGAIAGGWQGFVAFYRDAYGIEIGDRDVMFKPGLKNLP